MRLGYACINTELRDRGVYTSRTMTLARVRDGGISALIERTHANIADLAAIIEHNERIGVRFFHQDRLRGELADPEFGRWFFDIWLHPDSRSPALRSQLLQPPRAPA